MENLVVSLATAKKLKKSGWAHETFFYWSRYLYDGTMEVAAPGNEDALFVCYAPTAEEIADQLPSHIYMEKRGKRYSARNLEPDLIGKAQTAGTLAEALARLWLAVEGEAA